MRINTDMHNVTTEAANTERTATRQLLSTKTTRLAVSLSQFVQQKFMRHYIVQSVYTLSVGFPNCPEAYNKKMLCGRRVKQQDGSLRKLRLKGGRTSLQVCTELPRSGGGLEFKWLHTHTQHRPTLSLSLSLSHTHTQAQGRQAVSKNTAG